MLFAASATLEKDFSVTVFIFVTYRVHFSMTGRCSVAGGVSINMERCEAMGTVVSACFGCGGDYFSATDAGEGFVYFFHRVKYLDIRLLAFSY